MTDEVKRVKYRYLLNSLQTIRAKLRNLEEDSKDLYATTNSDIKIDGECIVANEFEEIKDSFTNIKYELREKLMFIVSKKI